MGRDRQVKSIGCNRCSTSSAEFFPQMLERNLSGTRPPATDNKHWQRILQETAFKNKLKMKIPPDFTGIYVSPLRTTYNKKPHVGSCTGDDEGVRAREVCPVQNGVLRDSLTSRVWRKDFINSNGHGRAPVTSSAEPKMGNLFVLPLPTHPFFSR